jgi:GTP-binding protein
VKAELARNAGEPGEFPRDGLPEVAVLGRSNSGKSNLINALLGRRRLARTSARPGRTRRIHFYRVADAFYLVDLPGYGYAAVPRGERRGWRPMVESYLRGSRAPLRGALLLADVRRGLEEEEMRLLEWLEAEGVPVVLVLTKADKLSRSGAARRRQEVAKEGAVPADRISAVSARTGQGIEEIARWIEEWSGFTLQAPVRVRAARRSRAK